MARKRKRVPDGEAEGQDEKLPSKTIWHPLNLQQMPLSRFVVVVNRILRGSHTLISGSLDGTSSVPEDEES